MIFFSVLTISNARRVKGKKNISLATPCPNFRLPLLPDLCVLIGCRLNKRQEATKVHKINELQVAHFDVLDKILLPL